jgi:hypothetical protein
VAVAVAALAQVLIYLPGVLAIGFPSTATLLGFVAVTALVPAVALGSCTGSGASGRRWWRMPRPWWRCS